MTAPGVLGVAFGVHRWRVRQHILSERVLLPVCAWCTRIRDEDGSWSQLEAFVKDRTDAEFTHGICPVCTASIRSAAPSRSRSRRSARVERRRSRVRFRTWSSAGKGPRTTSSTSRSALVELAYRNDQWASKEAGGCNVSLP